MALEKRWSSNRRLIVRPRPSPDAYFIQDCLVYDPANWDDQYDFNPPLRKEDLYEKYDKWCARGGYKACNEAQFTQRLKMALSGLEEYRATFDNGCGGKLRPRCWKGLRFRRPHEDDRQITPSGERKFKSMFD